jgi:hypothetical protein
MIPIKQTKLVQQPHILFHLVNKFTLKIRTHKPLASITRQIGNSKLGIEIFDDGTGTGKKKTKCD